MVKEKMDDQDETAYLFFFIQFESSFTFFPWKLNLCEIISKIKVPLHKKKKKKKIVSYKDYIHLNKELTYWSCDQRRCL